MGARRGWTKRFTVEVAFDTRLSPAARLTYFALCHHARQAKSCFPSQELLAEEIGCSVRNIRRYLDELEDAGLIRRERGGNGSPTRYYLRPDTVVPSADDSDRTALSSLNDADRTDSTRQTGQNTSFRPDTSVPLRRRSKKTQGRRPERSSTFQSTTSEVGVSQAEQDAGRSVGEPTKLPGDFTTSTIAPQGLPTHAAAAIRTCEDCGTSEGVEKVHDYANNVDHWLCRPCIFR